MRRAGIAAIAVLIASLSIAACGTDEGPTYSDKQIVEKLNLKQSEAGYAIDGDPFCEVEKKLLNDASAIEDVAREDQGLVVASRAGNVGVQGVPPFANDCREEAQKKLDRLDPKAVD
jgi:hypothetical protein